MTLDRRELLRNLLICAGGTVAMPLFKGILRVGEAHAAELEPTWHKAPCRFCGTGCGTEVAVNGGRIVAVRGDEQSPVNKGLLCAKGYGTALILYGEDRLTQPMIRNASGVLEPATWDEALDLIAAKWTDLVTTYGPDAVAMYGSGQWTIPEGYAALKLMKGGVRTNNLEANARFCMASAVVGFLQTYGVDEPAGCYDDLDLADNFFLWGANMADMHPMLFNRIQQRRQADPNVKVINLSTFGTRTNEGSDETHIFVPQTDLTLANAMAYVLVQEGFVAASFVNAHVNFKKTVKNGDKDEDVAMDLATYTTFLEDYKPADVAASIGIAADDIVRLARMYGDPARKCVSLWTMGVNQHTRGVWMNNLLHNLHLLTGKVATPGNGPLSLTGQPSACGTCREVGTFTHRLPSDRVVANATHRAEVEAHWGVPAGTIPSPEQSPLTHTIAMWEKVASGAIKSIWVSTTNPFQTIPDIKKYREAIAANPETFIIVSDIYPTETTKYANVVLPSACWVEKEGLFGNTERRTHHFAKLIEPPGEARADSWQIVEVARRMGHEALFPTSMDANMDRSLYEEYRGLTLGTTHDVATYEDLVASRGLRWPVYDGKETRWRFNKEHDPNVPADAPDGIRFYGKGDGKAVVWARPYVAPPEVPSEAYPFWLCTGRVLEHWHTGTMTRRVPSLHRAVPEARCYLNAEDAAALGVKEGSVVKISSVRGEVMIPVDLECRFQCPKGYAFVPFFDEELLINEVTLGALDPVSKQPDYKKCAVKIEKVA